MGDTVHGLCETHVQCEGVLKEFSICIVLSGIRRERNLQLQLLRPQVIPKGILLHPQGTVRNPQWIY